MTLLGSVDVGGSELGWLVSNDRGRVFGVVLPPGAMTANATGTYFKYQNRDALTQGGIYRAIVRVRGGTSYVYTVDAYGDMSAATDANMAIQFYVGALSTPAIHSEVWTQTRYGWAAHGSE